MSPASPPSPPPPSHGCSVANSAQISSPPSPEGAVPSLRRRDPKHSNSSSGGTVAGSSSNSGALSPDGELLSYIYMYRAQDGRVEPSPAGRSSDFETEPAEQGNAISNNISSR
ncbi:uncharacterized protein LOC100840434 isoform X3 [Brachypodium distachyon]|uniref:uncharacterized protein LOC100840434 isoform X3 n=1 Tax=Brachypodium distachyon TaxID=15368 RepID=UPI000234FBD7|nr:uncharacterized protein LOC100840434 isoform X3 [Brachypodium distachyon]|eukprot:XP_014755831.1 uncharacterized protein LOC100840434 isoform X3 [Brachypodium distachyon]